MTTPKNVLRFVFWNSERAGPIFRNFQLLKHCYFCQSPGCKTTETQLGKRSEGPGEWGHLEPRERIYQPPLNGENGKMFSKQFMCETKNSEEPAIYAMVTLTQEEGQELKDFLGNDLRSIHTHQFRRVTGQSHQSRHSKKIYSITDFLLRYLHSSGSAPPSPSVIFRFLPTDIFGLFGRLTVA
ncbi:hypothetical protein J6590_079155 [Homalodisca vitripennis]|nr:hypothetical protein J6590_079155 [Homalodisca vitripennis]